MYFKYYCLPLQGNVYTTIDMDGFKSIEIKNFRGIDHLKVDDFSRVNVFLGQNNSGKSTVLEAIALALGMSNLVLENHLATSLTLSISFII